MHRTLHLTEGDIQLRTPQYIVIHLTYPTFLLRTAARLVAQVVKLPQWAVQESLGLPPKHKWDVKPSLQQEQQPITAMPWVGKHMSNLQRHEWLCMAHAREHRRILRALHKSREERDQVLPDILNRWNEYIYRKNRLFDKHTPPLPFIAILTASILLLSCFPLVFLLQAGLLLCQARENLLLQELEATEVHNWGKIESTARLHELGDDLGCLYGGAMCSPAPLGLPLQTPLSSILFSVPTPVLEEVALACTELFDLQQKVNLGFSQALRARRAKIQMQLVATFWCCTHRTVPSRLGDRVAVKHF
jgi:hypothetical protein